MSNFKSIDAGPWTVTVYVDSDKHLNVFIENSDNSQIHEIETLQGSDDEHAMRFTTEKIEDEYKESVYG